MIFVRLQHSVHDPAVLAHDYTGHPRTEIVITTFKIVEIDQLHVISLLQADIW
jgi:hypothetical protein